MLSTTSSSAAGDAARGARVSARGPRLAEAQQLAGEVAAAARRIVDRHPQIAA